MYQIRFIKPNLDLTKNRTRYYEKPSRILGREIRAELVRCDKTVSETAKQMGARRATLSNKLLGHTAINIDDLFAISDLVKLKPSEFIARAEAALPAADTPAAPRDPQPTTIPESQVA